MKTIHFIINPQAKNGYSLKVWDIVEKELQQNDIYFTVFFTERRGHATEMAKRIKEEHQDNEAIIIVVGGDGTLHEVLNGVVGAANIRVGFIPGGSGNDFMRGFGIPKEPISALSFAIEHSKMLPAFVDIGEITNGKGETKYFINNMGVGFDALIAKEANQTRLKKILNKLSLGNLIYAYFVIQKIFSFKLTNVILTVDGKKYSYEKTWFITIANQPYFGGGMKIAPKASSVDGLLNLTVVHGLSRIKFLFVFVSVFWGGHTRFKEVQQLAGKNIKIETESPLYVHGDGEYAGETPVHIKVKPRTVPLLIKK